MTTHESDALITIGDFIRWAASRFQADGLHFGHGTDNALDEAAALVLGTLHLPPDLHAAYLACRVTDAERATLKEHIDRRRAERLPVPYLLGEAWFCELAFKVNEDVLIPRSPIAELIEARFEPWVDAEAVMRIADVGTGSGCIAIAAAMAFPGADVVALDNAPAAVALAADNARRHGVGQQVDVRHSDLLEAVPEAPLLDLIVSNPPYVDGQAMADLPAEYRHEPQAALAAGDDGLEVVRRLLPQAARRLSDQGVLVCEVGHGAEVFEAAFPALPVTWVELAHGGAGVFVVDALTLREAFPAAQSPIVNGVD
ncbi:50S ribosomal protein L3 N(5)-glutamine methyltransferase [Spiribacter salinus]|uniref:50S ribosomal protein L3 N(5)-glutamine methyltransferase n=1 Tax=Spiribacter salinus TaxID=1335746 RepID=UPI001C9528C7|nr:50S ribosomal protein L3 N(5)-glutamine methyltransferase [Spiribacter salinus]MBY5268984.1 ribosomal protein L3 N(5)-glutamine methyltransferase [Spiribacter salinus]